MLFGGAQKEDTKTQNIEDDAIVIEDDAIVMEEDDAIVAQDGGAID